MTYMPYFGVIQQILEVDYNQLRVLVFKCKWVNGKFNVCVDDMWFTLVDLNNVSYKDESFIMVEQAKQVFYLQDSGSSKWSVILQGRISGVSYENQDFTLDVCDTPSFSICMPSI